MPSLVGSCVSVDSSDSGGDTEAGVEFRDETSIEENLDALLKTLERLRRAHDTVVLVGMAARLTDVDYLKEGIRDVRQKQCKHMKVV